MKKKLLLCITAAAFLVACGDKPSTEDPYADLRNSLTGYNDACAQVAFKDTSDTMDRVDQLVVDGKSKEAADLYIVAKEKYDKAVADYTNMQSRSDRVNAEIENQKSRLDAIDSKAAPAEYNTAVTRVNGYHTLAEKALEECDVAKAETNLTDADKEIRFIEDLIRARSAQQPAAASTSETYVVKKGDCLWKIAASKYSNPYFWPLIYWANTSTIKDPDLIYPDQNLKIEFNNNSSMKADAEKLARTRGAWSLYDNK